MVLIVETGISLMGTRLPFSSSSVNTFEVRETQRVDLRSKSSANSPTGGYCCDIPTAAVHNDTDRSVTDTVYVGLYTGSGGMLYCQVYARRRRWVI